MAVNPWRSRDIRAQGHGHYLVRLGESVYMCPAMIIHYILGHSYAPPPGFVEAVINGQFLTLGDLEFKMDYIEGASMIRPARTWETARLRAKPADLEDLHVLHADYARDPEMTKFLTWKPHKDLEETRDFLRQCALRWLDGSGFPWSLWLKDSGALAGLIEIRGRGNKVDVGYALARRWWRQGLMTEALSFVVQWSLSQPDIHRVWATCDINNVASIRLLERVGMNREGVLRRWDLHPNLSDQPRDCYSYAIVKD